MKQKPMTQKYNQHDLKQHNKLEMDAVFHFLKLVVQFSAVCIVIQKLAITININIYHF